MGAVLQTPEDYRKRAAFLRKLADQAVTEALESAYLELAANWEILADEAAGKDSEKSLGEDHSPGQSS